MIRLLALTLLVGPQSPVQAPAQNPVDRSPAPGACAFVGASHAMTFAPGVPISNTLVTTGDPDTRRFIVYVPSSYQVHLGPYPVLYMHHGTGQTAGVAVTNTHWDEAAEALGFIAVFPEALPYLLQDGTTRTKWRTDAVESFAIDPSELPMADDTLFLRELHNTIGAHLFIDCDRVYASGFSNGGTFVKEELRVDLADVFAATSSAGGVGVRLNYPGEFQPTNGIDFRPHFEVIGNLDGIRMDVCVAEGDLGAGQNLPMAVANIVATPCLWDPLTELAGEMGLDPAVYTGVEGPNTTQIVWSSPTLPGPTPREYRFRVLRNLIHEYPNGTNYPVDYVPIFYDWMSQYTR